MRDGIKIAVDLCLPKDLPGDNKIPAILIMARYWRSFSLRTPDQPGKAPMGPRDPISDFLVRHGYAVVQVDVRGSGASYGTWEYVTSSTEMADMAEVAAWAAKQTWCNGRIGAVGISYEGSTAELLAASGEPSVHAIIPQETEFDIYTDIVFPGGIRNEWFIDTWNQTNHQLDQNKVPKEWGWSARLFVTGVRPVDGDEKKILLQAAIKEHNQNPDVHSALRGITYRDDLFGSMGVTLDQMSFFSYQAATEKSNVPIFSWGSWLDGNTANAVLHRFINLSNPQIAVIGAWSHNMKTHASPFAEPKSKPAPDQKGQWHEVLSFFDHFLLDQKDDKFEERVLYYYTLGIEKWQKTVVWPPDGTQNQRWFMRENGQLTTEEPTSENGEDVYQVDLEATTGRNNRWHTPDGMTPVIYKDRLKADQRLLIYTSDPFPTDIELTGHPVVTLYITSTAADGAFYVYLEEVDQKGKVIYLTEGQLRAIHRKISSDSPPYRSFGPYHSFQKLDTSSLVPGEVSEISFALIPTSVQIKKGHRLRVAIAGHDKDTFTPIPEGEIRTITIQRNSNFASYIDLPLITR
ncbi:MAG: CocE/NonD family hydrolase, partial [Anaerolineales bacterium]